MSSQSYLPMKHGTPSQNPGSGSWRPCDRAEALPAEFLRASFADRRPGP